MKKKKKGLVLKTLFFFLRMKEINREKGFCFFGLMAFAYEYEVLIIKKKIVIFFICLIFLLAVVCSR